MTIVFWGFSTYRSGLRTSRETLPQKHSLKIDIWLYSNLVLW